MSKKCFTEKVFDLLLIGGESKRHYVLIKDFKTFMYYYTLHRGRKHSCRYFLQAFSTEKYKNVQDCSRLFKMFKIVLKLMASK